LRKEGSISRSRPSRIASYLPVARGPPRGDNLISRGRRATIDRRGRLFLSYDYWSTYWFYRTDHRGSRRALLTSADGGETWSLAQRFSLSSPSSEKEQSP